MSGWRDSDGRTASERRKQGRAAEREQALQRARHRPSSLIRPALGALFIGVLILALLLALR